MDLPNALPYRFSYKYMLAKTIIIEATPSSNSYLNRFAMANNSLQALLPYYSLTGYYASSLFILFFCSILTSVIM